MPIPGRAETVEQKVSVLRDLLQSWDAVPKLRLGQLVMCALGSERALFNLGAEQDLFNIEDDELVQLVAKFAKEHA